ncbi:BED zinc finger [Ancylostoma ceylanicum]|uniref:BED zinc finger n=1 Tax=Ancylostoma ceylanicum TaxID=53326 RepID=A0A0D6M0P8_9BILA|nr:BED zinc finger [Ancylostoma ceylanicum]
MMNNLAPELGRRKRAACGAYRSIEDVVKKTKNTRLRAHLFNTAVSYIWSLYKKAFDDARNELAICNTCSKVFKIPRSRTTSNLLEHVRKKHPEELEKATAKATTKSICDDDSNNNQRTIDGVFARKISPAAKRVIDRKFCQFVATSSLPLLVVTLDSFKELLGSLNKTYLPPTDRTLVKLMTEEVASIDRSNL